MAVKKIEEKPPAGTTCVRCFKPAAEKIGEDWYCREHADAGYKSLLRAIFAENPPTCH